MVAGHGAAQYATLWFDLWRIIAATAGSAWSGQLDRLGKQAIKQATGDEPNERT